KITWILSFMQSGMAQLFRDHFMVYMNSPEFRTQYLESTEVDPVELLYRDIYKAFGDPNKQATAIQEITTLRQGSKSAEEHVQVFKQSYMWSGYGETASIHEFKRSLNTPLLNKLMAVLNLPTTLEGWYELTIRLDCQWRQVVAERKVFAMPQRTWQTLATRPQQTQWRPPAQPAQRDPNAMQVDRNRGPIRCYNCGQTGHMAQVCLNPRQQQTRLMSMWNNGTDEERTELWRMMGGGVQVGGGVARMEEAQVVAPVAGAMAAQPPVAPFVPQGFQFSQ
ncbi:hypothetical protein AMATHDRAFT_165886, partial [Amanita thiersii Skay4041]